MENTDNGFSQKSQSSSGEGASLGTGKWDKYKTDSQETMPFHYHRPVVCLLRYANGCGSCCLGHGGAAVCSRWMPLPRGARSVSLRQGHQHCTRDCWELQGLPAWPCWTEQGCLFLWLYQIKLGLWSWNLYLFHYWFNKIFYQKAEIVDHVTLKLINYLNRSWEWSSKF